MSVSEICVVAGGGLSLVMFLFHTRFYRLFDWAAELKHLSARNQRIVYTIHLALLLLFLVFGLLSLFYYAELAHSRGLGRGVCASYAAFWLWRTVWQVLYFRPSDRQAARLHYGLTVIFACLFLAYAVPAMLR